MLNSLDNIFVIESFYNIGLLKLRLSLLLVILTTDFDRIKTAIFVILLLANIDGGTAAFAQLLSESVLGIEAISRLARILLLQFNALSMQEIQIGAGIS